MSSAAERIRCEDCPVRRRGAPYCWRDMREQLMLLRPHASRRELARGEVLFRQGEPVIGWWLVGRGQVLEYAVDAAGREQIIRMAPAGSPVGLAGLRMSPSYCISARAGRQGAEVWFIDRDAGWRTIRENPELACALLVGFAEELHLGYLRLQNISTLPARAVVASTLLSTTECRDGRSSVSLTRGEIASMCGLAVETVVRVLGEMRAQGLIEDSGYGHIELLDPCRLHRISLALDERSSTSI
ncbi:CRP/FNR family transcriptional regulator [Symbiobacterium terraclitae]|uniref:CRP/FNR family transcriptional regulator n=1 Tax=Symbiobacterium terraclitae TaxID=557451 RepID=A0ABS4JUA7_9FIRM|nr:Crp/Fnr family transcriptional regulator [Symbiobacterium terraclitae]MBP2019119.1 CRP/FNR family transcriptional regulator [Symbiobacterium terraclitae]